MGMTSIALAVSALSSCLATLFAVLCFVRLRQITTQAPLTKEAAAQLLRSETEIVRNAGEGQARGLRQELGKSLANFQEMTLTAFNTLRDGIDAQIRNFGERLDVGTKAIDERVASIGTKLDSDMTRMGLEANTGRDSLRAVIEQKLDESLARHAESARGLRDELSANFQRLGSRVSESLAESGQAQKDRLEAVAAALNGLTEKLEKAQETLRAAVEGRLDAMRQDNAVKLEEMRVTVGEKLEGTLEQRLGNSFKVVSAQLEQVFRSVGEMQTLATDVGGLKKILANVKMRGVWGEVSLGNLLEQVMTTDQFERDVEVKPGSNQRVEFAIKLPGVGDDEGPVWLPVDAKFPVADYERLVEASERSDLDEIESASKAIESGIRAAGKDICSKYVHPPHSTDFAVMFLPIEGLFAEVVRRPGLVDLLQREFRIVVTGPTTLMALLNSLRMG
jgi:DNA recombination protein RmuC